MSENVKTYIKDTSIVARKIADETILVPIRHNIGDLAYMYTLSDVGSRIWELLNGGRTVEEMVAIITQEYEVEAQQAKADLVDFLAQMMDIGAVVEKAGG